MTNRQFGTVLVGVALVVGGLAYTSGKRNTSLKITWYSDMTNQIQGHKIYLIDTPVACPNRLINNQIVPGKILGKVQVDINLYSGQLKVVENSVPAVFTCEK